MNSEQLWLKVYWLILLNKTEYLTQDLYESLKLDVDELIRMIIASLKTTKGNEKNA